MINILVFMTIDLSIPCFLSQSVPRFFDRRTPYTQQNMANSQEDFKITQSHNSETSQNQESNLEELQHQQMHMGISELQERHQKIDKS